MSPASSLWLAPQPLLLASGSATRRDMLLAAGIPVEAAAAEIDERAIDEPLQAQGVSGRDIAAALAQAKARDVAGRHPGRLVLGADQTLICEGAAFHKPADWRDAGRQLAALSGRSHELHSAFALIWDETVLAETVETARLTMRVLSPAFLEAYVAAVAPSGWPSVGGYQIEGLGAQLFEAIEGDHFTILGLPLLSLLAALRSVKLLAC